MRFPETFCFQLTPEEVINLKSQIVTSSLKANQLIVEEISSLCFNGTRNVVYIIIITYIVNYTIYNSLKDNW